MWNPPWTTGADERDFIVDMLAAAYRRGRSLDALKAAAYRLEANSRVTREMLSSVLKSVVRDRAVGGEPVSMTDREAAVLGMYADDLRLGR